MGFFKRANWHSGLTYVQTCPDCHTKVTYKDDSLGFRPWFPDGFVYCPTCQKPLRHNENLAIDKRPEQKVDLTAGHTESKYCANCGRLLNEGENFCPNCGTKR